MSKDVLLEVLASARSLDSSLRSSDIEVRFLQDKNGLYHSNPVDPLLSILGVGNEHFATLDQPSSVVFSLDNIDYEMLCRSCFKFGDSFIDCITDWELSGTLKGYHVMRRLADLDLGKVGYLTGDIDMEKFSSFVDSFLVLYSMLCDTELDYNYVIQDGRDTVSVLDEIVRDASKAVGLLHQKIFGSSEVRFLLEGSIIDSDGRLVSVVLGPLSETSFWSGKPDKSSASWLAQDRVKAYLVAYSYGCVFREVVARVPLWLYNEVERVFPEIISSSVYLLDSYTTHETAKKLYEENDGELFSSFDECVKSAVLLEK